MSNEYNILRMLYALHVLCMPLVNIDFMNTDSNLLRPQAYTVLCFHSEKSIAIYASVSTVWKKKIYLLMQQINLFISLCNQMIEPRFDFVLAIARKMMG